MTAQSEKKKDLITDHELAYAHNTNPLMINHFNCVAYVFTGGGFNHLSVNPYLLFILG